MAEMYYVNFDYNTPFEDIQECMGFNPDGTININYTLMTLKNKLMKNIILIEKLLDNHIHISNLIPSEYNKISITINNKEILESLIYENVINNNETDIYDNNENLFSDEETNQERLNRLNNIINTDNYNIFLNKSSDDSESSTEEIISDEKNIQSLLNKYKTFTKNLSDDDSNDN